MATLVLSSLGAAVGGPIGGAIGSLIGQSVDRSLFGLGLRQGPRLGDLAVQTSTYGSAIPRVYGRMRVAGTVVWATDLVENSNLEGGGKGGPGVVSYSYSASFAVALSSRPAVRVRRIWADGKLLRGEAGDFKVGTKFRFYSGDEDQPRDALIASAEGIERTPAFRGLAIAVFEELQLAEFGNRIPVLTFELEADDTPVALDHLLGDASGGAIVVEDPRSIGAYAAYGESRLDALRPLVESFDINLVDRDGRLRSPESTVLQAVRETDLGCSSDSEGRPTVQREAALLAELPRFLSLSYYDAERDYQAGEKHASVETGGRSLQRVELPAVVTSDVAKGLAEAMLAKRWNDREAVSFRLSPKWIGLLPGEQLQLADMRGNPQQWTIKSVAIEGLTVVAECRRKRLADPQPLPADAGEVSVQPDRLTRMTRLELLDLPPAPGEPSGELSLYLAAAGGADPWRAAPVHVEVGGRTFASATARTRAVMGRCETTLAMIGSALIDLSSSVDVELMHDDDWLRSCDDQALAAGENMAAIGDEIIQFGTAVPLGARRFRLTRLLRGRAGTEWASAAHGPDERFVLLTRSALVRLALPETALTSPVSVTAAGPGDNPEPGTALRIAAAEPHRPPSPVHLRALRDRQGSVLVRWTRRSRFGWPWLDEQDAPLGERSERYRVTLTGAATVLAQEVEAPAAVFSPAQIAEAGGQELRISVSQLGDFGASRPATIPLAA